MKDEMKKILQMVKEGKITVNEAEKLLDALEISENNEYYSDAQTASIQDTSIQDRFLRIRVTENGEQKVQVNLPLSLVEIGLKLGMQGGPEFASKMEGLKDINFKELVEAVRNGANGKLVEVDEGNQHVEIYVD